MAKPKLAQSTRPPILELVAKHRRPNKRQSDDWPEDLKAWLDEGLLAIVKNPGNANVGVSALCRTFGEEMEKLGLDPPSLNVFGGYYRIRVKELRDAKAAR